MNDNISDVKIKRRKGIIAFAGLLNGILILVTNYGFANVSSITANNILATKSIFGLFI